MIEKSVDFGGKYRENIEINKELIFMQRSLIYAMELCRTYTLSDSSSC